MDTVVLELTELLRPSWGSEKWILEGWNQITAEERLVVKARMDQLFRSGLPFELKHDKIVYIYAFSMLAQLEVLAIQVPLKFEKRMSSPELKAKMRAQLMDEIFHGLVFTRILYMLCAPYAYPPAYSENIEKICDFIRTEECPKIAVVLLNLVAEGWIEETFKSFQKQGIALEVFDTILEDEHRHVCEAELYREIGLPDSEVVRVKLEFLEEQLLVNVFGQAEYMAALMTLFGGEGSIDFMTTLHKKHKQQLAKINLYPGEKWIFFMETGKIFLPKIKAHMNWADEIEMTPMRRLFMRHWNSTGDPSMVAHFNVNVTPLEFFNKKYPPETLTTVMMQVISQFLEENIVYRSFLSHSKIYQTKKTYLAVIVKLPNCADQMGSIVFEDCHTMNLQTLSLKIRSALEMMVYCYKKREQLEQLYPHLKMLDLSLLDDSARVYPSPIEEHVITSVSNIGAFGWTQAVPPLRKNEALRFTLMAVDRRQVWNNQTKSFEVQDLLPIAASADHRLVDGNYPVSREFNRIFMDRFTRMEQCRENPESPRYQLSDMMQLLDQLLDYNVATAYSLLQALQTVWLDFLDTEELFETQMDISKQIAELI